MTEIGVLLIFWLPPGTTTTVHKRLSKKLYGEATSSFGGRYKYRRKGLLDDVPHVRIYTGVLIVRSQDVKKVIDFLEPYGATVVRRRVILNKSDERILLLPD